MRFLKMIGVWMWDDWMEIWTLLPNKVFIHPIPFSTTYLSPKNSSSAITWLK